MSYKGDVELHKIPNEVFTKKGKPIIVSFYRNIFPQGLPDQFSFICTFRTRRLQKSPWHIVRVTDLESKPQFLITLNPRKQTIEFSIRNYEGRLQTIIFEKASVSMTDFAYFYKK